MAVGAVGRALAETVIASTGSAFSEMMEGSYGDTVGGLCKRHLPLLRCLFIGRYEPLVGAYPEEYGAFCVVIAFAVLMVRRSHAMAAENTRLQSHLQEEVREKTQHLRL